MIKTAIFTYLLALATLTGTSTVSYKAEIESLKSQSVKSAVVFVGDSRTVGMKTAIYKCIDKDNEFFIAEAGEGYTWLKNTGLDGIKNTISSHSNIDDWTIVTNLGVNDLENAPKYVDTYKKLMEKLTSKSGRSVKMYVISVNPVDENKCKGIKNADIENANYLFESSFENCDSICYIDTNTYTKKIMSAPDGLHYTDSTYFSIYQYILKNISNEKKTAEEIALATNANQKS